MRSTVAAALLIAACGGAAKEQAPPKQVAPEEVGADPAAYTAVADVFARKRPLVAQCFGFAIENRELPENARVRVKLGLRVMPSGAPEDVKVVEASQKSKTLEDCVVTTVSKWTLPAPAKPLDFVYIYEFSNS